MGISDAVAQRMHAVQCCTYIGFCHQATDVDAPGGACKPTKSAHSGAGVLKSLRSWRSRRHAEEVNRLRNLLIGDRLAHTIRSEDT